MSICSYLTFSIKRINSCFSIRFLFSDQEYLCKRSLRKQNLGKYLKFCARRTNNFNFFYLFKTSLDSLKAFFSKKAQNRLKIGRSLNNTFFFEIFTINTFFTSN